MLGNSKMYTCAKVREFGKGILLSLACCTLVPVTISQVSTDPKTDRAEAPPPSAYTGNAACVQCHRKESEFYALTPHARDSAPGSAKHIIGSFSPGRNVLHTSNPNLVVTMIAAPDGFY